MIPVVCSLCASDAPVPFLQRKDRFTGATFTYVRCSECGMIYLNPRPTAVELEEFYPKNYEAYYIINERMSPVERWQRRRSLDIQLDFVERSVTRRGRLLDIGCGTGSFLKHAQARGWIVTGLESSHRAANLAREKYGLHVLTGSVQELARPDEEEDVITLWDVLEHLPDPKQTLLECHRLLAPGGMLFFSIPNLSSLSRYVFRQAWIGWDAPRHLHLFTEATVRRLLKIAHLELVEKRCILGEEGATALSAEAVLGVSQFRRAFEYAAVLLWPYRQLAYLMNRGSVITFVARKTSR